MRFSFALLIGLIMIILTGCTPNPNTGKGFSLPKGDASAGKAAFIELACNKCHSIADIEQLPSDDNDLPRIKLGGSVKSVKTYGELITSIINPSHKVVTTYVTHPARIVKKLEDQGVVRSEDGSSTMQTYNDIMTVAQLVDLVTFLEENYELNAYERSIYSRYDMKN